MPMQGVEISHFNAALKAGLIAYYDLLHMKIEEALRPISAYGKKDTLGMDSGPEITICEELAHYDSGAAVITEEIGSRLSFSYSDLLRFMKHITVFIIDPTDRSNQLKAFLRLFTNKKMEIGEIIRNPETIKKWEKSCGSPAAITGATSAISCVRKGLPIFTVIINYITQQLMISCAAGNRILDLPESRPDKMIDLDFILKNGKSFSFPIINSRLNNQDNMQKFVTFLGDTGKAGYEENFVASGFIPKEEMNKFIHYGKPGGPSRALYLSSLQPKKKPVGFVLANGEKIGEWIHWLTFLRFAKSDTDDSQPALVLYEISQNNPWTKEGILMSTPPNYSIFKEHNGLFYIDTNQLLQMPNPSKLRGTLMLANKDNRWAKRYSRQLGYREIVFDK